MLRGRAGPDLHDPVTTRLLVGVAAAKFALHAATAGNYGYHRDELYYIVGGRRLDLGYVDHPPLTPWLAAAADVLSGHRLAVFRLVPALAGAAIVVLAGLIARELGGRRWAQLVAATAVLANPLYLATNALFQTVSFDQLAWVLATLLLVRLLRGGRPRLWLDVGAVVGVGLLTKYTILLFVLGVAAGLAATSARAQLATPWPWLGVAVAALVVAPNLAWQVAHGWPTLEFVAASSAGERAETSVVELALNWLLFVGPVLLPLALVGMGRLWNDRSVRPLAVAAATVVLLLVALRAKPYYAGPLFPTMFAAGAVAWEAHRTRAGRHGAPRAGIALLAVSTLLTLPLTVPLLPRPLLVDSGLYRAREDFAEMFGWPELAATVTGVYHGLPSAQRPQATVLTGNYGQAAALDRFAPGLPAASGHNSYWLWRPREARLGVIVAVGLPEPLLRRLFAEVELVAVVTNAEGVDNDEFGTRIHVARGPRRAPEDIWRALRHFN